MDKHVDLRQILSEVFKVKKNDITIDSNVNNIKNWDSLAHVNLIISLENKLNIKLDAKTASRLISVREILKLLKKEGILPISNNFIQEYNTL